VALVTKAWNRDSCASRPSSPDEHKPPTSFILNEILF
jgi:hypothetical protein